MRQLKFGSFRNMAGGQPALGRRIITALAAAITGRDTSRLRHRAVYLSTIGPSFRLGKDH